MTDDITPARYCAPTPPVCAECRALLRRADAMLKFVIEDDVGVELADIEELHSDIAAALHVSVNDGTLDDLIYQDVVEGHDGNHGPCAICGGETTMETDRLSTHWTGCWRSHHDCAIAIINQLIDSAINEVVEKRWAGMSVAEKVWWLDHNAVGTNTDG